MRSRTTRESSLGASQDCSEPGGGSVESIRPWLSLTTAPPASRPAAPPYAPIGWTSGRGKTWTDPFDQQSTFSVPDQVYLTPVDTSTELINEGIQNSYSQWITTKLSDFNVRVNVPSVSDRQGAAEVKQSSAADLTRAEAILKEIEQAAKEHLA